MSEQDRLASLTLADFAPLAGTAFTLHRPDGATEPLELAEARPAGSPGIGMSRAPFSLLFRAAGRAFVPQGIHALDHPTLGRLEIFLVPIGPDGRGMRYEAIFA